MIYLRPSTDKAAKKPAPQLVVFSMGVATGMTGNPYFPNPTPTMPVFKENIATFSALLEKGRRKGSDEYIAFRRARTVILNDLGHLCDYVTLIAEQDPEHAEAIINSSGFPQAQRTPRTIFDLIAKALGNGTVLVRARKIEGAILYYWQISTDGGMSWRDFCDTPGSIMKATGLTPGTEVFFQFHARTRKGMTKDIGPARVIVT